jgi:hypothetical protein
VLTVLARLVRSHCSYRCRVRHARTTSMAKGSLLPGLPEMTWTIWAARPLLRPRSWDRAWLWCHHLLRCRFRFGASTLEPLGPLLLLLFASLRRDICSHGWIPLTLGRLKDRGSRHLSRHHLALRLILDRSGRHHALGLLTGRRLAHWIVADWRLRIWRRPCCLCWPLHRSWCQRLRLMQ